MQTTAKSMAFIPSVGWEEVLSIVLVVLIVYRLVKRRRNRLAAKGLGRRSYEPSAPGVRVRVCNKCGALVSKGFYCPECGHSKTVVRICEMPLACPECRSCGGSVSDDARFCQHCGAALSAKGSRWASAGPASLVAQDLVGRTCPYDQVVLKPNDDVKVCPYCSTPHHRECWEANGGCTTIGCQAAPPPAR
jgi:hypothetical protein